MKSIEQLLLETNGENQAETDWTEAWSGKYPVLKTYRRETDIPRYAARLREMMDEMRSAHGYSERDAMLVLKDILYHEYKGDRG